MPSTEKSDTDAAASSGSSVLDTFDHVVVLMLENRSFDNLLGFIYPNGVPSPAPAGTSFEGASLAMSNPVPQSAVNQPPDGSGKVFVTTTTDYHQPYPDPGEEYYHVNVQLFDQPDGGDCPPYNLPPAPLPPAGMQGFVTDYVEKLGETVSKPAGPPTFAQYSQIMQCFDPSAVPVLSTLAQEFAVFDHWYCAVPSQTWCNRAFWHAATSWGRVNNSPAEPWFEYNQGKTIFNQISDSGTGLSWKVYHDTPFVSLTNIIHFRALDGHELHFHSLDRFFEDCENGDLPSYSFLEPDFILQHNDYHPSSAGHGLIDYETTVGTVLLGERLVARIYNAIRTSQGKPGPNGPSGNTSQNTLLIITFDEHGGCFDHVQPIPVTAPDLTGYPLEEGFDFTRSGIRVPTIMVSAHIAPNTVINTPMLHSSFLNTVQAKWGAGAPPGAFAPLTARQESANLFTEVFTAAQARPASEWKVVQGPPLPPTLGTAPLDEPLDDLGQSIIDGAAEMLKRKGLAALPVQPVTRSDAVGYLAQARAQLDAQAKLQP
ncbi:MAG TPA: alkaline phosphatase family protein [Croceibacterium sp.]